MLGSFEVGLSLDQTITLSHGSLGLLYWHLGCPCYAPPPMSSIYIPLCLCELRPFLLTALQYMLLSYLVLGTSQP